MPTAQFSEIMFVVVGQDVSGRWMPVVFQGAVLLFTDGERAARFLATVNGLPESCKVSRESGWERVIGALRQGERAGADGVVIDAAETGRASLTTCAASDV